MERGLDASIWARASDDNASRPHCSADWICSRCRRTNFQWRVRCFRCNKAIDSHSDDGEDLDLGNFENAHDETASHNRVEMSQEPQSSDTNDQTAQAALGRFRHNGGLSTSRWAPRNRYRTAKQGGDNEIWTRTATVGNEALSANAQDTLPIRSQLDLDLPYQVQHFILAMIQRIMEDGCFLFASTWIPEFLGASKWTCAEAVELSTWKKVLPITLPKEVGISLAHLEDALANAVRIRNAAVHRHLCSNHELRQMASQASRLISLFADVSRQAKLDSLVVALRDWDSQIDEDQSTKRTRLEAALQAINEQPLDDMDWTPNSVSLQEITDVAYHSSHVATGVYGEDEMDID